MKINCIQLLFFCLKKSRFIILLFSLFISGAVGAQNQRIKLPSNSLSIQKVFKEIEKQTNLSVDYNQTRLNVSQLKNFRSLDNSLSEVLNIVLKNTGFEYTIEKEHIIIRKSPAKAPEQAGKTRKVKGVVLDNLGEPIIGANIIEEGTTNGTITDAMGNFNMEISSGSAVQVSFIGYLTETIPVENSDDLVVKLREDTQLLDEVVVIGYGTVKRKDFTGSVSSVKLENSPIALAPNLNALESLKGNVSGLNVGASNSAGASPSLQIRGQNSISGSNDPLVVLDGVIYLGSIRDINPNDIASIDVLKDATSAAAYGSRAANGVVAITTKKGSSEKPVITFNANLAAQTWQNRPELMNGEQWFASVNERNGYEEGATNWLTRGQLLNMESGKTTDWLDEATRTGFVQDYQAAISGSASKVNYYVSTSYSENKGIIVGDDFDRLSLLGKLKTDITSWLEVGLDAAYSRSDYSGTSANLSEAYVMSPYGVNYRDEEKKLIEK